MKLYLSSYRLGNDIEGLKKLVGKPNAKVAVIDNALDFSTDLERRAEGLRREMGDMIALGFEPEHVDLRQYFDNNDELFDRLEQFDVVWVKGGNAFLLRKAMWQSGFDRVVEQLIKTDKLIYSGYSAALCVISTTLDGVELVDDADVRAEGYVDEVIWDGYGLIDWYPIVHYKSNHPESELVDKQFEYIKSTGRKYKTLRDGDTIIIDTMR